jgi:hypothetical protein
MAAKKSLTTIANEQVSILEVCRQIQMDIPDEIVFGRSAKVFCPFGDINHPNGNDEAAFRIYPDSNSAWCFVEQKYFSPVGLYAEALEIPWAEAAERLLELVGWREQPATLAEPLVLRTERRPDQASLAEALAHWCARFCRSKELDWNLIQFEPTVMNIYGRCLDLLSRVHSSDDVSSWLRVSKQVMELSITNSAKGARSHES